MASIDVGGPSGPIAAVSDKPTIHNVIEELVPPVEDDRYADPIEARKKAMNYLARREYGHRELCAKLEAAGFLRDVAAAAVEQLRQDGLQDDGRFVGSFVQSRINQGKGPVVVRADLRQRGIATALVEEVLAGSGQNWHRLAREVRHKKFGTALPPDFKEKARQMRFLQYRGFEPDHIQAAVGGDDD